MDTTCPTPNELQCYLSRSLHERSSSMLSPHIEHCPRCKAMISAMASQDTVAQDSDAMPISSPLVSRQILRRIGDYEVVEELGRGGMGVVYKAWDKELRCYVAIKTILASRAGLELVLHRFRQEAQSLAKLRHPNIVAVHRMGSDDGTDYFVMDFIEGENLLQVIGQREISPRLAAEITSTICEGTQFAHEHQILHRDLKPANILLDNFGRVYITDFGLAKQLDSDAELSRDGQIFGTAAYMPPEQACGKMNEIDARSDVYSIGAILYHILSGQPPFGESSILETLDSVRHRPPQPLSKLNRLVPRDLETICLKCLEKDPQRRYASARNLRDDLQRYLLGYPPLARRASWLSKSWRWARRNRAVSLLATACLLAVTIGVIAAVQRKRSLSTLHHEMRARVVRAESSLNQEIRIARQIAEQKQTQLASWSELPKEVLEKLQHQLREYQDAWQAYSQFVAMDVKEHRNLTFEKEAADTLYRIAEANRLLGNWSQAVSGFDDAAKHLQGLNDASPDEKDYALLLGEVYDYMGEALRDQEQHSRAEAMYHRAIDYLRPLVERYPDCSRCKMELARAYNNYGVLLWRTCHIVESRDHYRVSTDLLDAARHNAGDPVMQSGLQRDYFRTLLNLAQLQERLGRDNLTAMDSQDDSKRLIADARRMNEDSVAGFTELYDSHSTDSRYIFLLAVSEMNYGHLLHTSFPEDIVLADKLLRQAQQRFVMLPAEMPEYRLNRARCENNLACFASDMNQCRLFYEQGLRELLEDESIPELQSERGKILGGIAWLDFTTSKDRNRAIEHARSAIHWQAKACEYNSCLFEAYLMNHQLYLAELLLSSAADESPSLANQNEAVQQFVEAHKLGWRDFSVLDRLPFSWVKDRQEFVELRQTIPK